MKRRHFLGAIIASCMAPAIVRASSLMPVRALPFTFVDGDGWVTYVTQREAGLLRMWIDGVEIPRSEWQYSDGQITFPARAREIMVRR